MQPYAHMSSKYVTYLGDRGQLIIFKSHMRVYDGKMIIDLAYYITARYPQEKLSAG